MNELQSELNELKQFIADLKDDRAAAKEKERREGWTKYVSLTVVVVAVFAAIATQWAGKYSGRVLVSLNSATYNQAQASDQWAFYQAKSIKQNLYELSRGQMAKAPEGPEAAKQAEEFEKKIAKYEKEKGEILAAAKGFEKERDLARQAATEATEKGGGMGLAVSLFSVAIAMASICLVTKKKPLWFFSGLLALVAMGEMFRVWVR
jgi:hypothetical protein